VSGNLERNTARGDPFYHFDLSLTKSSPIREKLRLELRADFFKLFKPAELHQGAGALNRLRRVRQELGQNHFRKKISLPAVSETGDGCGAGPIADRCGVAGH
jgi:hypothetical protein